MNSLPEPLETPLRLLAVPAPDRMGPETSFTRSRETIDEATVLGIAAGLPHQ